MTIDPNSVRKTLMVRAPAEVAWDVFTAGMTRWWPPEEEVDAMPSLFQPRFLRFHDAIKLGNTDGSASGHRRPLLSGASRGPAPQSATTLGFGSTIDAMRTVLMLFVVPGCRDDPAWTRPAPAPTVALTPPDDATAATAPAPAPAIAIAPDWQQRVGTHDDITDRQIAVIDDQHIAIASGTLPAVELIDLRGKDAPRHIRAATVSGAGDENVNALIASPREVVTGANGALRVWSAQTGARVRELLPEAAERSITGIARLADGSLLASVVPDRTAGANVELRRWTADGTPVFTVPLPSHERWSFGHAGGSALSPDRNAIAIGTDEIAVLDAQTGAVVGTPSGFVEESRDLTARIHALAWSGGAPIAASAANFIGEAPATIHVLPGGSFTAHPGALAAAAWLPGDRLLTAGRTDGHVTVRDTTGRALCELTGARGNIVSLAISADGATAAVSTSEMLVAWSLAACAAP